MGVWVIWGCISCCKSFLVVADWASAAPLSFYAAVDSILLQQTSGSMLLLQGLWRGGKKLGICLVSPYNPSLNALAVILRYQTIRRDHPSLSSFGCVVFEISDEMVVILPS